MIPDNGLVADQIVEYLRKELVLYESVYKLTMRQRESVVDNDTDMLMGILNQKQKYIQRIDIIQRDLVAATRQWPQIRDRIAQTRRDLINMLTDKVKARLSDIIILEKENMGLVQSRKEALEVRMQRNHAGKDTINHYLSSSKPNAALIMDRIL
jgi:hypothetical protein